MEVKEAYKSGPGAPPPPSSLNIRPLMSLEGNWTRQRSMSVSTGTAAWQRGAVARVNSSGSSSSNSSVCWRQPEPSGRVPPFGGRRQRRASEGCSGGGPPPQPMKRPRRMRRHHSRAQRIHRNSQCAPNNNNEFLMEEHDSHIDELLEQHTSSSPEDEEEFQSRDFTNAYDVVNAERLSTMTKPELVYANQLLEDRVDNLEKRLKELANSSSSSTSSSRAALEERTSPMDDEGVVEDEFPQPRRTSRPCLACFGRLSSKSTEDDEGEADDATSSKSQSDLVRTLRYENDMLKVENRNLRRALAKATSNSSRDNMEEDYTSHSPVYSPPEDLRPSAVVTSTATSTTNI